MAAPELLTRGAEVRACLWQGAMPPVPGLRCSVIVPARNEEGHLGKALKALSRQTSADGSPCHPDSFEVIVLANNCTDGTARVAHEFRVLHPRMRLHVVEMSLPPHRANVGVARRLLMDEACRRLETSGRADGIIASTDADTCVADDWLAAIAAEIAAGADAIGGRITVDPYPSPGAAALRRRRLDALHALLRCRLASLVDPDPHDPWPNHHQHFGASLACTARAYRLVGGVPRVQYLEDEALVRELERADLRVRRSPHVKVTTSGRLDGRAEVGLSWQLRQWSNDSTEPSVENPVRYVDALQARRAFRQLWLEDKHTLCAADTACWSSRLGLDARMLVEALQESRHFGAFWAVVEHDRLEEIHRLDDRVPLGRAIETMRRLVSMHR